MTGLRRVLFLIIMGVGGVAILAYLGVWQMQRLAWKNGVIAELEARLSDPPRIVAGDETRDENYAPAIAAGRFLAPEEAPQIRFLSSLPPNGPGFRIITVFELDDGERILVDRGFAPQSFAPKHQPPPPPPLGQREVSGVLHWPREVSSFTPEPNAAEKLVFARDVEAMADILGTRPVMLVAREPEAAEGAPWPRPLPPSVDLPNDHLGYAITWFSLAAVWAAMTALVVLRRRRALQ